MTARSFKIVPLPETTLGKRAARGDLDNACTVARWSEYAPLARVYDPDAIPSPTATIFDDAEPSDRPNETILTVHFVDLGFASGRAVSLFIIEREGETVRYIPELRASFEFSN